MPLVTTFLMFDGTAEEAMTLYTSVLAGSTVLSVSRYAEGDPGKSGTVRHATFALGDQRFMCIDSAIKHAFTFTPATSIHVSCDTRDEVDRIVGRLAEGGQFLMPLGSYPFSDRYAWFNDRFGVSWQVALIVPGA
jgi:predicted 3-demethylubiquinone-9 3-methyltransferase (glyoxalase superfamily)